MWSAAACCRLRQRSLLRVCLSITHAKIPSQPCLALRPPEITPCARPPRPYLLACHPRRLVGRGGFRPNQAAPAHSAGAAALLSGFQRFSKARRRRTARGCLRLGLLLRLDLVALLGGGVQPHRAAG